MRSVDFWFQLIVLVLFVALSPFALAVTYPTSGDQGLIWIWMVVVNGITAMVSLVIIVLLNLTIAPTKTYVAKVLIPLLTSYLVSFRIGSGMNPEIETPFVLANLSVLIPLYLLYALAFRRRMKRG